MDELKNSARSTREDRRLKAIAYLIIVVSLFYQPFWCFVNTHIFQISTSVLVLTEVFTISLLALYFIKGPFKLLFLILIIFVFVNTLVVTIFQNFFEYKLIRNFTLPILLIWLGTTYKETENLDKIVKYSAFTVIAVGILEFILPTIYSSIFNVVNYHIAIGRSTELAAKYVDSNFSLNGTRWGGRNLLPFLGDHRASSIFLETVNMGNFGVLLACWGLSKESFKQATIFIAAALIVAVLADSRFASTLIFALIFLRLTLPIKLLQWFAYLSPILVLLVCFYFQTPVTEDNFKGRLGSTGYVLSNFKISEYFGLSSFHYSMFVDQGYAYIFHFSGIVLAAVIWFSLARLRMENDSGNIFKALISILIAANLAISGDSAFSFKWVTIMWFLLGALALKSKRKVY